MECNRAMAAAMISAALRARCRGDIISGSVCSTVISVASKVVRPLRRICTQGGRGIPFQGASDRESEISSRFFWATLIADPFCTALTPRPWTTGWRSYNRNGVVVPPVRAGAVCRAGGAQSPCRAVAGCQSDGTVGQATHIPAVAGRVWFVLGRLH